MNMQAVDLQAQCWCLYQPSLCILRLPSGIYRRSAGRVRNVRAMSTVYILLYLLPVRLQAFDLFQIYFQLFYLSSSSHSLCSAQFSLLSQILSETLSMSSCPSFLFDISICMVPILIHLRNLILQLVCEFLTCCN